MMVLNAIFLSDENYPLFGTPLFKDDSGELFYQQADHGGNIVDFVKTARPLSDRLRVKGIGYLTRNVGDGAVYCVALSKERFIINDIKQLRETVQQRAYIRILSESPFALLEIAQLLDDRSLISDAAKLAASSLARSSPRLALRWIDSSGLNGNLREALRASVSDVATDSELVALRISVPEVALRSIDQVALVERANRAFVIRNFFERARIQGRLEDILSKTPVTLKYLERDLLIGRDFANDAGFREHLTPEVEQKGHAYVDRDTFKKLSERFKPRRSTVRLDSRNYSILTEMWEEHGQHMPFRTKEEFFGYFFLQLMIEYADRFDKVLLALRDDIFGEVKLQIANSIDSQKSRSDQRNRQRVVRP